MKRWIILLISCGFLFGGCKNEQNVDKPPNQVAAVPEWQEMPIGRIGDDFSITRAQAAKMMALAFYDKNALQELSAKQTFADVAQESWYAPYVNGSVEMGFLAGDETGFHPEDALTLEQAQALLERLHPKHKTKINVTDETKNKPVSYSLWLQIFEDALKQRKNEDSLYSYGIQEETITPLQLSENKILSPQGTYQAQGYDITPYFYKDIKILTKDDEIVALLEITENAPMLSNVYYYNNADGIQIEVGMGKINLSWANTEEATKNASDMMKDMMEAEGIAQIQLDKGKVTSILAIPNIGNLTIKKVDTRQVELEGMGNIPWAENAKIYEKTEKGIRRRQAARLITGTDIATFYQQDGKICAAVITKEAQPAKIRVLLSKTGQQGYIHDKVSLSSASEFILTNGKASKKYEAGKTVSLSDDPEAMALLKAGRICVTSNENNAIIVHSITRNGNNPSYFGTIELEQVEGGYRIINELPLEQYLCGVVPGEMPTSFGLEALKVQAVAARSYAYNQFYANRYGEQGAHVDDTTNTQVYVGNQGDPLSDKAIAQTEGICLTYGKTVVTANFFSSTCGYTASAADVWRGNGGKAFPGDGKPYLQAKSQGLSVDVGDLSLEENAVKFFKQTDIDCYDSESPYVRWQTTIVGSDLTTIINRGAAELWQGQNGLVQIENAGAWQDSGTLPVFSSIKEVKVIKRGQGGNVMLMEIIGDTGKIRVQTENAVRRLLKPSKVSNNADIIVKLHDGSERNNMSLLPSGFFIIEQSCDSQGNISSITFFGGGNGHGVGMSQYGAKGMSLKGYSYQEILEHYFEGAKAEKVIP